MVAVLFFRTIVKSTLKNSVLIYGENDRTAVGVENEKIKKPVR